jgi:hypothetical protein
MRNYRTVDAIEFSTYNSAKEANHTTTINISASGRRHASAGSDSNSESEEQLVKGQVVGIQVSKSVRQLRE